MAIVPLLVEGTTKLTLVGEEETIAAEAPLTVTAGWRFEPYMVTIAPTGPDVRSVK
jgi:hypothetical protein